jgi:hypothetical protein
MTRASAAATTPASAAPWAGERVGVRLASGGSSLLRLMRPVLTDLPPVFGQFRIVTEDCLTGQRIWEYRTIREAARHSRRH